MAIFICLPNFLIALWGDIYTLPNFLIALWGDIYTQMHKPGWCKRNTNENASMNFLLFSTFSN